MRNFNNSFCRARDESKNLAYRYRALRELVEVYCSLTGERFNSTFARLGRQVGFDAESRLTGSQLNQAANILDAERRIFLRKLRKFAKTRKSEKQEGRRKPTKSQLEVLHTRDWLLTE